MSKITGIKQKPNINKLGTIDLDMVETTPVVFKDRLYLFEYVRENYWSNKSGNSYFRFLDIESGWFCSPFGVGYHLGSAIIEEDTIYCYGSNCWGGNRIQEFWSQDMVNWQNRPAIELPGWRIFNTSICKSKDKYFMAFEIDAPPEETGIPFTIRFAISDNLVDWRLTPANCVFSKEKYSACPCLRFIDEYFYMLYLEAYPGPVSTNSKRYATHIVRSPDLINWKESRHNPFMMHSDEDRLIMKTDFTNAQITRIKNAVDINNSDVDVCEYHDRTFIFYSWGNQEGIEFLAQAEFSGTLSELFKGFFE